MVRASARAQNLGATGFARARLPMVGSPPALTYPCTDKALSAARGRSAR